MLMDAVGGVVASAKQTAPQVNPLEVRFLHLHAIYAIICKDGPGQAGLNRASRCSSCSCTCTQA
jgi:hypothetical protein